MDNSKKLHKTNIDTAVAHDNGADMLLKDIARLLIGQDPYCPRV